MQASNMAIGHLVGEDPVQENQISTLAPGASRHMARYAPDVRASILGYQFLTQCSTDFTEASGGSPASVTLNWNGQGFATLHAATAATLARQVQIVRYYTDQRADRAGEILTQLGTVVDYFLGQLAVPSVRVPYLSELLVLTQQVAGMGVMPAKHLLACRRPDEIDSRIMPLIPAPTHGSLPSGHATQAHAISVVVRNLLDQVGGTTAHIEQRKKLVSSLAHRIAVNRTVAGVHYPMDSWAGAIAGRGFGEILTSLGQGQNRPMRRVDVNPNENEAPEQDFVLEEVNRGFLYGRWDAYAGLSAKTGDVAFGARSGEFEWLWAKAATEVELLVGQG